MWSIILLALIHACEVVLPKSIGGRCKLAAENISLARRLSGNHTHHDWHNHDNHSDAADNAAQDCRHEIGIEIRWFELSRSAVVNGTVEGEFYATFLRAKTVV